jgi:hypothetical protein
VSGLIPVTLRRKSNPKLPIVLMTNPDSPLRRYRIHFKGMEVRP